MLSLLGLTAIEALTSGFLGMATGLAVNAARAWNHPLSRLAARVATVLADSDEPSPPPTQRKTHAKK